MIKDVSVLKIVFEERIKEFEKIGKEVNVVKIVFEEKVKEF